MKPLVSFGFIAAGIGVAYLSACSTIVGITDLPSTLADGGSGSGSGSSSGGSGDPAAFIGTWSGSVTETGECNGSTATPQTGTLTLAVAKGTAADLVASVTASCLVPLQITSPTTATLAAEVTCKQVSSNGDDDAVTYKTGKFTLGSGRSASLQFSGASIYTIPSTGATDLTCTFADTGTLSE